MYHPPVAGRELSDNPMINRASSGEAKFDIETNETPSRRRRSIIGDIAIDVSRTLISCPQVDLRVEMRRANILLKRSFFVLARRGKLVWGSTFVALFWALLFGWILGQSTNEVGSVLGVFSMGAMLLLMSTVQFVFFLFCNNQVPHYSSESFK
jgi:hypothetical protein